MRQAFFTDDCGDHAVYQFSDGSMLVFNCWPSAEHVVFASSVSYDPLGKVTREWEVCIDQS